VSPLRGWMRAHGRPGWWSWLVVVLVPLMASMGVLVVSLRVNEQSIAREREQRRVTEQALCGIIVLLDDANRTAVDPPSTDYGRKLARAIRDARTTCPAGP
jgi:hypothetical protein